MMANTKLNKSQKEWLAATLSEFYANGGTISRVGRYTVAKMPEFSGSRMARFAVSVCSKNEKKIRTKPGQFFALQRVDSCMSALLPSYISAKQFGDMLYKSESEFNEFALKIPNL